MARVRNFFRTPGEWAIAEESYKKAVAQDPRNAALLCNYGAFLQDARQDMVSAGVQVGSFVGFFPTLLLYVSFDMACHGRENVPPRHPHQSLSHRGLV